MSQTKTSHTGEDTSRLSDRAFKALQRARLRPDCHCMHAGSWARPWAAVVLAAHRVCIIDGFLYVGSDVLSSREGQVSRKTMPGAAQTHRVPFHGECSKHAPHNAALLVQLGCRRRRQQAAGDPILFCWLRQHLQREKKWSANSPTLCSHRSAGRRHPHLSYWLWQHHQC